MYMQQIIGRNLVITTEEKPADSGTYVTTVINKATDTLVDSKAATNEQDASKDFSDMLVTYALPLQSRVINAHLEPGKRYTLVMLGNMLGVPCALRFTFEKYRLTTFAQYDDAILLIFKQQGGRVLKQLCLYDHSFAIYEGWRDLPDDLIFNVEKRPNGIVSKAAKYVSFDERYMDDIKAAWPDFVCCYDHPGAYRPADKKPEPMPDPDPAPVMAHEIATGLTVLQDEEHGLCVDMTPETFAMLYGTPEGHRTAEEILTRALLRATAACMAHIRDEDGGTCNFDSPTLDYKACGLTRNDAERIIKAAGLSCYDWEKQLVITGPFAGQGNRRTAMARAFCESMTNDGVASGMYYQMD